MEPRRLRTFATIPSSDERWDGNEYIRVLVFMDVSSPNLVEASAAAQASIQTALQDVGHRIRQRIFIRVQVHGYQNADTFEVDSTLVRIDGAPLDEPSAPQRTETHCFEQRRAPAVPTDGEALRAFVIEHLRESTPGFPREGESEGSPSQSSQPRSVDPFETLCCQPEDSVPPPGPKFRTILFIWGHGEGVGNRLDYALDAPRTGAERLPAAVEGASLLGTSTAVNSPLRRLRNLPCDVRPADPRPVFDLMVFDSCLMATAELAYECRDLSQYVIASQTLVQRPGLSLGRAISEYLITYEQSLKIHIVRFPNLNPQPEPPGRQKSPTPPKESPGNDPARDAAKAIIDTAGELHSGADQLTLFRVRARIECTEEKPPHPPESLGDWLARAIASLNIPSPDGQGAGNCHCSPPCPPPPDVARRCINARHLLLFQHHAGLGVFTLFAHLLRWASADEREQPRILAAFKNALYIQVRQFLDLKDLARQVYHYSRLVPLRVVALELMRELEESDCGLVVRWRATIPAKDRKRYGGVSVYCPWFDAKGPCEFDAIVEHDVYRELDLPDTTGWGGFVLGAMYDATAGRRRRDAECERRLIEQDRRWTHILRGALRDCDRPRHCGCGGEGGDDFDGSQVKGGGPQADGGGPKGGGPAGAFGGV